MGSTSVLRNKRRFDWTPRRRFRSRRSWEPVITTKPRYTDGRRSVKRWSKRSEFNSILVSPTRKRRSKFTKNVFFTRDQNKRSSLLNHLRLDQPLTWPVSKNSSAVLSVLTQKTNSLRN